MRSVTRIGCFLAAALLATSLLRAGQRDIRLRVAGQQPCWSLEEIVSGVTAGLASEREKALALHEFGMKHQIHFAGPFEDGELVVDALKLLNVYGCDLCGNNSSAMCALYNLAGLKARRRGLVGHVVPEVWFEGKWNYIDTDMFGYVYLDDKQHLASVDELIADPDLWTRAGARRPVPFFPWDPPEAMKKAFIQPEGWHDYHPYSLGHSFGLSLRTHEAVTCWYRPRERGFYYLDPQGLEESLTTQYRDYWLDGPVRLGSLAWTDTVPAAYGNGCFEYTPDLRSEAFRLENPEQTNVLQQSGKALPELVSQARGKLSSLVLEVKTPWVITGSQNDLINFKDNTGAAVARGWFWRSGKQDENRISLSTDCGRTWETVWENNHLGAVPFAVDLTSLVDGGYGYRVKFEWLDRTGEGKTGLEGLSLETWTELSPMALPHLEPGQNEFHLSAGTHEVFLLDRHACRQGDLPDERLENLGLEGESDILGPVDLSKPGSLIFSTGEKGLIDELRLAIEARRLEKGGSPKVTLSLSENGGNTWQDLAAFSPEPEHDLGGMWFNHVLKGRSLDGANTRLRLTVENGLLARVTASGRVRRNPGPAVGLRVSHLFAQGSSRQTVTWDFPSCGEENVYTVEAPSGVHNVNFRIEALPPEEMH
ncbi:hypothetical protein LLH00_15090 [bacterium]|nr:hypothetical protein [bacterium]